MQAFSKIFLKDKFFLFKLADFLAILNSDRRESDAMAKKSHNVRHLQNQYVSDYNRAKDLERKRKKYKRRRLGFIAIVGFILLLIPTVPLVGDYMRVREFESQKVQAADHLQDLEDYQEDLEYYVSLLEDEDYVAKLARSEYYLSGEDEIIFNLPEDYIPDHQRVIDEFHEEQRQKQAQEDTN